MPKTRRQDFLPMSGKVLEWKPATGAGVRIDAGIRSGQDILAVLRSDAGKGHRLGREPRRGHRPSGRRTERTRISSD